MTFLFGGSHSNTSSSSQGSFNQNGTSNTTRPLPTELNGAYDWLSGNQNAVSPYTAGQGTFMPGQQGFAIDQAQYHGAGAPNADWLLHKTDEANQALTVAGNRDVDTLGKWYGNAPSVVAAQSGSPGSVSAQSGAANANPYLALADQNLIDPSLQAYDYGTARNLSALDARTAGAGGFANSRSEIPYGDLMAQSAMGRGQLEAQLKGGALDKAFGYGGTDASRALSADQGNQGATLQASLADAAARQAASQFNSNMVNNRQQFDVNSANTRNDQNINAATAKGNNATGAYNAGTSGVNLFNNAVQQPVSNFFTGLNAQSIPWQLLVPNLVGTDTDTTQQGTQQGTTNGKSSSSNWGLGGPLI